MTTAQVLDGFGQPHRTSVLSAPDIINRIEVRSPYFALRHLKHHPTGAVSAEIRPEQPTYGEFGRLSAAEAGRHMAILGSCALAAINPKPGQHYYLARRATFNGFARNLEDLDHRRFLVRARPVLLEGKSGEARSVISAPDGAKVFEVSTTFQVLSARLFEKLFASRRIAPPQGIVSPYSRPIALGHARKVGDSLCYETDGIPIECCEGHFERHASLPVAVLMQCLSRVAGELLAEFVEQPNAIYKVDSATIDAQNLAFPDEPMRFQAALRERRGNRLCFRCEASVIDSHTLGTMDLWLTWLNPMS